MCLLIEQFKKAKFISFFFSRKYEYDCLKIEHQAHGSKSVDPVINKEQHWQNTKDGGGGAGRSPRCPPRAPRPIRLVIDSAPRLESAKKGPKSFLSLLPALLPLSKYVHNFQTSLRKAKCFFFTKVAEKIGALGLYDRSYSIFIILKMLIVL